MRKTVAALTLAFAATVVAAGTSDADPVPQPCPAVPADRVDEAVRSLPPPLPDAQWVATNSGSSIDCTLNWVELDTSGGTVSSPRQILLFDHFKYGDTTTEEPTAYTSVVGSEAPGQITVLFRWLNPGDPNANPTGEARVRYQLSPQAPPQPIDPIPPEVGP